MAVPFTKALRHKSLQCGDALSKQQIKTIFIEALQVNVWEKVQIQWAERPKMSLFQLSQYADNIMQLGGNRPSSSKLTQPSLRKRDSQHDRRHVRASNRSDGWRNKACAMLARLEVPLHSREPSSL